MKRIEIEVNGKKYPFFRTVRSRIMFARSQFTTEDLLAGNMDAIIYTAYCIVLGACLRERVPFEFNGDYEGFIDVCPDDIVERILELDETPEKMEPKPTPEIGQPLEKKVKLKAKK